MFQIITRLLILLVILSGNLIQSYSQTSNTKGYPFFNYRIIGYNNHLRNYFTSKSRISLLPFRNIKELSLFESPNFYIENSQFYLSGIEATGNYFVLDGMRISDASSFPFRSISNFGILSSESSIQFGNSLGGLMVIQTPEPEKKLSWNIETVTSSPLYSLGNHMIEGSISGPINVLNFKNNLVPQFYLSTNLSTTKDYFPSWAPHYVVSEKILEDLESTPIRLNGSSIAQNVEFVTEDEIEKKRFRNNAGRQAMNTFVKLNIPLDSSNGLALGSYIQINQGRIFTFENALFNERRNPKQTNRNFDNFLRISHVSKPDEKEATRLQVQLNYASYYSRTEDPRHKNDLFNYSYLGKFESTRTPLYVAGTDTVSGLTVSNLLNSYQESSMVFSSDTINPLLAKYNEELLIISGLKPKTTSDFLTNGGLLNGSASINKLTTYGLWNIPGAVVDHYGYSQYNHYRISVDGSTELYKKGPKPKFHSYMHVFDYGILFMQTVEKSWEIKPYQLWTYMRNLTNNHLTELDLDNPVFIIGGTRYTYEEYLLCKDTDCPFNLAIDTIFYERKYQANEQNYFDRSLREKLGLQTNNNDLIDIDELSPETFSLDMFRADELTSPSNDFVDYYGYAYSGEKLKGKNTHFDFFTMKDANGNFTRTSPAYKPLYAASYFQYQFINRWLGLKVGLRLDWFDANQPVLKDKYSLYDIRSKDETPGSLNPNGNHPVNIGSDYAVYVDDFNNPNEILGYRDGKIWYDANGNELNNPFPIAESSTSGSITPYLVNSADDITSSNFDPNGSFQDYRPVFNLLPNLMLDIKLGKTTNIFINYNSSTQNPQTFNKFLGNQYYYLTGNINVLINNPALKPMRVDKISGGMKQKFHRRVTGEINYYVTFVKNLIFVDKVIYAYPNNYFTYSNMASSQINYGITTSVHYSNVEKLGLISSIIYTRQFIDGGPYTNTAGHIINTNILFKFGSGKNYRGFTTKGGNQPLKNISISFFNHFRTSGQLMGAKNLPDFDIAEMKINKLFVFSKNKLPLNVYVWVQNLFNSGNIFEVYDDTGLPNDDGFLTSPAGQAAIVSAVSPTSYVDLYEIKMNNPSFYDMPRIVRIGATLNF